MKISAYYILLQKMTEEAPENSNIVFRINLYYIEKDDIIVMN